MPKLNVFTHVSVDGFFAGPHGEIDWFKTAASDPEWAAYTHQRSRSGNALLFGRKTYEMMTSFWPTPAAEQADPAMTEVMRNSPKFVLSKAMEPVRDEPAWKHVTILHTIEPAEINRLKAESGDITILGSGEITRQLADLHLIDEYELVHVPVVLGAGKPLFEDVKRMDWKLIAAKPFNNGIVSLRYRDRRAAG